MFTLINTHTLYIFIHYLYLYSSLSPIGVDRGKIEKVGFPQLPNKEKQFV